MNIYFPLHNALVVFLMLWTGIVRASSLPPRPLKSVAHPSTLALEILPRDPSSHATRSRNPTLLHTDTFRLTFTAFDEVYHLHLRPSDHLVHPSARVNYYRTHPATGESYLHRTEPLLKSDVKAYWGEVVDAETSAARLREDAVGVRPGSRPHLGWARIMVHHQGDIGAGLAPVFEGAFSVDGVVYHVSLREKYTSVRHPLDPPLVAVDVADTPLVIWRESDVMTEEEEARAMGRVLPARPSGGSCSHDSLSWNQDHEHNPVLRKQPASSPWYDPLGVLDSTVSSWVSENASLVRRSDVAGGTAGTNFVDTIGKTSGCPTTPKILYMGVAADCVYVSQYGSQANATSQILNNWNIASTHYKNYFNVSLGVIELNVQDATCPTTTDPANPWNVACSSNVTLNDRLSIFSQWRGQKGDDGTGLWHLMSGCPTGTEVGVAWLGTLCQTSASGGGDSVVSGTAVTTAGRTEWQVLTHEIGHNFGAVHDCVNDCNNSTFTCCPAAKSTCTNSSSSFIMNPITNSREAMFSPCTVGNICSLMKTSVTGAVNTTCLLDPAAPPPANSKLLTLNMCGNGIVEEGEDCDPGPGVTSSCCDSSTCKFTSGAVCDPKSSACCTDSCSFAPSSQVCRPSIDPTCDTAEMCTGSSSDCPANVFAPNGMSCGNGLQCASGQCTSLNLQCQTVGASMNLRTACPSSGDQSCQVSCQDPTQSDQCLILGSQLIDGSPCGFGGTCSSGTCQAGNLVDTAKAWFTQNLQIAIPVTVVAGIIGLMLIYLLFMCVRRRLNPPPPPRARAAGPGLQRLGSYSSGMAAVSAPGNPLQTGGVPASLQPGRRASPSAESSKEWVPPPHRTPKPPPILNNPFVDPSQEGPRSHWVDETRWNGRTS